MKKLIVSALLVTGALLAQSTTPAPAGDTTKKTAKKHKKGHKKGEAKPAAEAPPAK